MAGKRSRRLRQAHGYFRRYIRHRSRQLRPRYGKRGRRSQR